MIRYSNLIIFSLAVLIFFSCKEDTQSTEFSEGPNGIYFKLVSIGNDTKKAKLEDVVLIKAKYRCQSDSLFWSSETDAASSFLIKVDNDLLSSKIWGFVFEKYAEGDSIQLKVDPSLFFKEVFKSEIPNFASKDTLVKAEIMIQKIMNQGEFENYIEGDAFRKEAAAWNQKSQIENYVKNKMKNPVKLDSLLYMEKVESKEGNNLKLGESVFLSYKGSFLNGKIIDQIKEAEPLVFTYGNNNQIIRGLEIALNKLKRGESAKIIIPSHLGFGNESGGVVPANTPLIYELKVIEKK